MDDAQDVAEEQFAPGVALLAHGLIGHIGIECGAGNRLAIFEQALDRADGNVSKTARLLNLQRTTLIEKIDKYRLRSA